MKPDLTIIAGGPDDKGGSPMPDPAAPGASGAGEVCVPLAALAEPDDKEQLQNPEPGDMGTMQVDYKVTRIEGDNAYVQPTAVNGKALDGGPAEESPEEEAGEPAGDPDDKGYQNLQGIASQLDQQKD